MGEIELKNPIQRIVKDIEKEDHMKVECMLDYNTTFL